MGKSKLVPMVIWGVVALGGFLSLWGLLSQPGFGMSLANIPAYAVGLMLLVFGATKAFNIDLIKMVSVA